MDVKYSCAIHCQKNKNIQLHTCGDRLPPRKGRVAALQTNPSMCIHIVGICEESTHRDGLHEQSHIQAYRDMDAHFIGSTSACPLRSSWWAST